MESTRVPHELRKDDVQQPVESLALQASEQIVLEQLVNLVSASMMGAVQ